MGSEMDTFAARLATFDTVLKPEKRRSSTTKGSKLTGWPHQRPSPAELAHAGFYYKPYETNPDNTTCFQCHRALDGWEVEDNPITEHLKHSPDCGWAIIMDIQQQSSNPATIEDPTNERIAQARLATFGAAWPHDGKRGWVCQSGKMVEAGWYFCPNEESNDLASCPYCKLSLDGWEPKDDPFDEHYRRSSDCSFFVFAQPPTKKGKGSRSKKARISKASSRLSTQSVATTTSETPERDIDESMDQSIMSQATVKAKSTKKTTRGKGKSAKSKKEVLEVETPMDVDEPEVVQPEPSKPKRTGRGKKRVSEEMNNDEPEISPPSPAEPPSKRRATRARSSSVSHYNYGQRDDAMSDTASVDGPPQEEEPPKRGRKKKGATSKNRKGSDVSVTSKSTSKSRSHRDSELDAALEAGLEADIPELIEPEPEPEAEPAKPRASKKTKTSKKSKAAAKASKDEEEDAPLLDVHEEQSNMVESHVPEIGESEEPAKSKTSKSSKKGTKKTKQEESQKEQALVEDTFEGKSVTAEKDEIDNHDSFVSVEIVNREPESRSEVQKESTEKPLKKQPAKKDEKPKKIKKTKKAETPPPEPPRDERDSRSLSPGDDVFGNPNDISDEVEMVAAPRATSAELQQARERTPLPAKTTKRFSEIPQDEHLAQALNESQRSRSGGRQDNHVASESSNRAVSPLPAAYHSISSLSPQSSDAENRPPSSHPSTTRPAIPSASTEQKTRTPLNTSTPSPPKRNANAGFPPSAHPWTPVDIDEALYGEASDKENTDLTGLFKGVKGHLTSPEKKMTVEQWIMWNAKNGEERLKRECERLVNQFENAGSRAMQRLEAIECID